jgi:hypothetical protein
MDPRERLEDMLQAVANIERLSQRLREHGE